MKNIRFAVISEKKFLLQFIMNSQMINMTVFIFDKSDYSSPH